MVADHAGDVCVVCLDGRQTGRTESLRFPLPLQHPTIPHHAPPNDGLLHRHGESRRQPRLYK